MKNKILIIIVVVVLITFGIIQGSLRSSDTRLKIGVILPLSDETASLGEKVRNGIKLAVNSYDLENRIEFIYEDGKIEPKNAVTAYQKLKSIDKAKLMIGPFGPDQTMAIAPLLDKNNILINISLCEDRFQKYPQIFCTYPSIPDQTMGGVEAIQHANVKKLGIIAPTGELGDLIIQSLENYQEDGGYKILVIERIKQGDTDFRTPIAKLKVQNVEGIYLASLPDEGYRLLKQINELQFNGKVFAVFDAVEEKLVELGKAAEGVYLPGHISPLFEKEFVEKYEATYHEVPDMYGALGHSTAITLLQALEENNLSTDGLSEKLVGRKEKTAVVNFTFKTDHTISIPVESLIFENGKIRELFN